MPAQVATLLCILLILGLLGWDYKDTHGSGKELWVPFFWMFLASSRYVSQWLNLGSSFPSAGAYLEGSPVDAVVFFILIAAGITILIRRRVYWAELLMNNYWIWLFFLFGLLSIFWSEYPLVSSKRWIKALGNPVMALVILTERRPYEAIGIIMRRLAFVLIPLSVLFIKYIPDMGRSYAWGGRLMYTGAAFQKNGLGEICLLSCFYLYWNMLFGRFQIYKASEYIPWVINLVLAAATVWLLSIADSATSLVCIVVATAIFILSRVPAVARQPSTIMIVVACAVVVFVSLERMLDASEVVIRMLGRDPSLTTRVPMWHGLLKMAEDPLLGSGYESFYSGDRLVALFSAYGPLRNAHNGYLETYLNLGLVGLSLLAGGIVTGLLKIQRYLDADYPSGILRLCLIAVVIVYNWTECTFYGLASLWVLLLFCILDPPGSWNSEPANGSESEEQPE